MLVNNFGIKMKGNLYVVMGVSGCGKTTIGQLLSNAFNIPFTFIKSIKGPTDKTKAKIND